MDSVYQYDCEFIQETIKKQTGDYVSIDDCYDLWSDYSNSYAAGWLIINQTEDDMADISSAYGNFKTKTNTKKFNSYEVLDLIDNMDSYTREEFLEDLACRYCFNCYKGKYSCICNSR